MVAPVQVELEADDPHETAESEQDEAEEKTARPRRPRGRPPKKVTPPTES